jgi:hypothetical protein
MSDSENYLLEPECFWQSKSYLFLKHDIGIFLVIPFVEKMSFNLSFSLDWWIVV